MEKIKVLRPKYREGEKKREGVKKLYGAVGALKYHSKADDCARRKGFYVLKNADGIASIQNEDGFTSLDSSSQNY